MTLIKYFLRLQYIDFLIRRRATGNLETFAKKNRLGKRNLAYILKDMKEMGFPIKYDKNRGSYYYTQKGQLVQKLFVDDTQILSRQDIKQILTSNIDNVCFSETAVFEPCENS